MADQGAISQFWTARAPRERFMLAIGLVFVLGVVVWAGLWLPVQDRKAALTARIDAQHETLQKLAEARTLRAGSQDAMPTAPRTGSAAGRADRGLRLAGLAGSIRRIEPGSDGTVNVSLERAPFDDLVRWLGKAPAEQGLVAEEMDADATDAPGAVNVRLRLKDMTDG